MESIFEQKVKDIVDQSIRPLLQQHGGNIRVKDVKDGNVWVVYEGACKTCPSAQITTEETVERLLREVLGDELKTVHLVNETNEELLAFAKQLLNKK